MKHDNQAAAFKMALFFVKARQEGLITEAALEAVHLAVQEATEGFDHATLSAETGDEAKVWRSFCHVGVALLERLEEARDVAKV